MQPTEQLENWKKTQECDTVDKLIDIFKKWFHLEPEDREFIETAIATILDREIPGDPVWMYLIAPAGGIKSELLQALGRAYPKAYTLDTLTESTFISGMAEKDKETGDYVPIAGILQDLDGKCVIIKDFTTVMSMNEDKRNEIYGQLRSIYDGVFEKAFGTMRHKISVKSKIGLVVGVTPIIDKYTAIHTSLGERFLKIRSNPNKLEAAKRALKNEGKEEYMREEIYCALEHFLKTRDFTNILEIPPEYEEDILKLAYFTAVLRTNTWSTYDKSGHIVDAELFNTEVPTRLAKQFKHFLRLVCITRGHSLMIKEDIDICRRLARDTAELKKSKILEFMSQHGLDNFYTVADIAGSVSGLYRASAPNHLNLLLELGVLVQDNEGCYGIAPSFREYVEAAYPYTLPSASLQKKPDLNPFFSESKFDFCARCGKPLGIERILFDNYYYCFGCRDIIVKEELEKDGK